MPKGINTKTGNGVRFKDRSGSRSGRLVFTKCIGDNIHRQKIWEAICDCGNITTTSSPHSTKSCGCLKKETSAATLRARALPADERIRRSLANRVRQRERRKSDPRSAMQARLSRLHRHALSQIGAIKTSKTFERLGYTVEDFVRHIERQFHSGMTWKNMDRWQVDHIIPVSSAKNLDDVVALNQLSNLRPMWSQENNKKKNSRTTLL